MIRITLNDHDRQQLEHTFTTTADRRLRDRCQAILMADRGRRHHQIAEDLRVTPRTLQRWLNAQWHGRPRRAPVPLGARTRSPHSRALGPGDRDLGQTRSRRLWLGPRQLDRGRTRHLSVSDEGDRGQRADYAGVLYQT